MMFIDQDILSTVTIVAGIVATLVFIGYLILIIIRNIRNYEKQSSSSSIQRYPPYAPGTMLHHIRMASSSQYPFWILDVANNQLGTNIFQLSLPLRPLSYKFVVGDAQTARDILMDDKSTKPMDIYGHMRNLNYRVSLVAPMLKCLLWLEYTFCTYLILTCVSYKKSYTG